MKGQSSLRQFVKDECSNFVAGRCIAGKDRVCPVSQGKRCNVSQDIFNPAVPSQKPYFDKCVLPLGDNCAKYASAADRYSTLYVPEEAKTRWCLGCGRPIGKYKRYCADCAKRKKRKSNAEYARRVRKEGLGVGKSRENDPYRTRTYSNVSGL